MKLLQLNAWGARLGNQVTDLLEKEKPDIICLQEAIDVTGDSLMFASIKDLQAAAKLEHSFHSPVFTFGFMNTFAHFGNTILSRYPFAAQETIFTNLEYTENFTFESGDYNIRNLQHAVIDIEGKKLNVLNHHGHHVQAHKNGNEDTLRQMKQIGSYLDTLDGAVILSGDFNLAPTSASLEIINSRLRNLSIENKLTTTRSALTVKTEVCDYIFVNGLIKVNKFFVSDELVSNHKPLILEFAV